MRKALLSVSAVSSEEKNQKPVVPNGVPTVALAAVAAGVGGRVEGGGQAEERWGGGEGGGGDSLKGLG